MIIHFTQKNTYFWVSQLLNTSLSIKFIEDKNKLHGSTDLYTKENEKSKLQMGESCKIEFENGKKGDCCTVYAWSIRNKRLG